MSSSQASVANLAIISGSPRKHGNTEILLDRVAQGFTDRGGKSRTIRLHDSGIGYCTGCFACLKQLKRPCRIKDSMDEIYEVLFEAEAIVLGSPVYFWSVSAQMKTFLDRLFPFGDYQTTSWAKKFSGIPFGVVLVYADKDPLLSGAGLAYEQIKVVIECTGGTAAHLLHYSANDIGDIRENEQALKEAEQTGAALYEQCRSSGSRRQGG